MNRLRGSVDQPPNEMLRVPRHDKDARPDGASDAAEREELRLVRGAAAGELAAFEALYRAYHPRLSRFLDRVMRRPNAAEEVLDDTMLVVWNRAASFNGSSKVSTWIFAIAHRKALKALRRWDEPLEDPPADAVADEGAAGPEQQLGESQMRSALLLALASLSLEQRSVVELTYFHGFDYPEIAQIVDCPLGTVKTRMFHARRRLKALLGDRLENWLERSSAAAEATVNGQVVPLLPDAHRELEELLPWYASGALRSEDVERVEQHLPGCAQCQADLAFERRLQSRMQALPPPHADVERGLARLRRRIDDAGRQQGAVRRARGQPGGWRDGAAWWRWALLAQGLVIAGLAVLLAMPSNDYRGLGDAAPATRPDAATAQIVVRFRADATERDIRAALTASGARVVNGPTATEAYVLAVPAARLQAAVAQLRAHAAVTLAESLEARTPP